MTENENLKLPEYTGRLHKEQWHALVLRGDFITKVIEVGEFHGSLFNALAMLRQTIGDNNKQYEEIKEALIDGEACRIDYLNGCMLLTRDNEEFEYRKACLKESLNQ